MRFFHLDHATRPATEPVIGHPADEPRRASGDGGQLDVDLPTCPECLAELRDPRSRRFEYAFITCGKCGPRFTIAAAFPADRGNTTMAAFRMCRACQDEFEAPGDRRYQAPGTCCPSCGPSVIAVTGRGARIDAADPIAEAARALAHGLIVAIKGIGGFQLVCDATSPTAVTALRQRKHRDGKAFPVMVADLAEARRIAALSDDEVRLLASPERPIVPAPRLDDAPVASGIAPCNPLVGVLLPYSPLHVLLLDKTKRPLVVTSGNVAGEPAAYTDEEALDHLGGIADLMLLHNREIVTRCDDGVARVIAGRPVVLRRGRGYVPRPLSLGRPLRARVLACGALRKSTFCFARDREAVFGPHLGRLESLEAFRAYRELIDRFERLLRFEPEIVAHDLHPDYLSTHYALARHDARAIGVQHHHAHVASVMAEHGVAGPVIGVAYDRAGLGTDGTAWGGEVLVAEYGRFERVATMRPLPMTDEAIARAQPWRVALAMVDDAFGGDAPIESLAAFREVPGADIEAVRAENREPGRVALGHGVGRYFEAMGTLALARPFSGGDCQVALAWNLAAERGERGRYRYDVRRATRPWQLDLRPAVRDAVFELIGGEPAARISARFHNTLAAATSDLVRGVACVYGRLPVALSGACFQNQRLVEGIVGELAPEFTMLLHGQVPPGDGGLALGQAVIADAIAR